MALNLDYVNFTPDREDSEMELLDALDSLARLVDNDFSGENGDEYNWEDTIDGGFENNADYVYNYIKVDIEQGYYNKYSVNSVRYAQIVEDYLEEWMGHDSYYVNYDYTQPELGSFAIAWNDQSYC